MNFLSQKTLSNTKHIVTLFGKSKHQIMMQKCQQEICEFSDYYSSKQVEAM